MKRFILLAFLLFFLHRTNAQMKVFEAAQYGISPEQDASVNTKALKQLLSQVNQSGGKIIFPAGRFLFQFDSLNQSFLIKPSGAVKIELEGAGSKTILVMDIEEANKAYTFIKCRTEKSDPSWYVEVKNLQIEGPRRYGKRGEKNPRTTAILIENGQGELVVENVTVKGCFFTGILGTGAGKQTIKIENCTIEQSSNIGAGLFGTGFEKHFICRNTKFLRNGIPTEKTLRGKAYGASIYCHPNINIHIKGCSFFNNGRNAIQLASGTALYNQKFDAEQKLATQYQIFEQNYFDSTCHDGIQLGFYFPKAIISGNRFFNRVSAIQGLTGSLIEANYFGKSVVKAIEYKMDFKANEEDSIRVRIRKNRFDSKGGLFAENSKREKKVFIFESNNNLFKVKSTAFSIGTAYVGDTSMIYLHSLSDTFFTTVHGNISIAFNNKALIDSPVVYGKSKFIVVPKEARGAETQVNAMLLKSDARKNQTFFAPNPKYADANARIEFRNTRYAKQNARSSFAVMDTTRNWKIFLSDAICPKTIQTNERIGDLLGFEYNTYRLKGKGGIRFIYLYNDDQVGKEDDWKRVLAGQIKFIAMDGFQLQPGGNIRIQESQFVPAGSNVLLEWNRKFKQWTFVRINQ
jgi:hypothetical protein